MRRKGLSIIQMCLILLVVLLIIFFLSRTKVFGSELLYEPINPSFGGSPLNGSWLLNQAQLEDPYGFLKDQKSSSATVRDPMSDFQNSLARQIFSRLSSKIIDAAFGEEGLKEGEYNIGDYNVVISSNDNGIVVTMTDKTNGNVTVVEVPYY